MPSIVDSVKSLSDLIHLSKRRVPSAPDGLTNAEAAPSVAGKPTDHGKLYRFIQDIEDQIKRGLPVDLDEQTFKAFADALEHANTSGVNDRYLLLEKILTLLARLPPGGVVQNKLTDAVIKYLYDDLPHPPATLLGKKYAFRSADGANNNPFSPDMGKAKTPYARTVQSTYPIPYASLPEPELVFDALLKRDGTKPHPSGISSLLFAFANVIIHSLFKTDEKHKHINNTSSYLDLSPLYGDSTEAQRSVRQLDGRGLLWPDAFADQRMLLMPPATPALLVVFSRNHNFIARRLLELNEFRTYVDPPPTSDPAKLMNQDDDIFNRARLINCGHFMNIILSDYIGAILGLTRDASDWYLNPLNSIRELDHSLVGRGQGNVVSVEFNLLYRWHATISVPDEKWTQALFQNLFPDVDFTTISPAEYRERIMALRVGPSAGKEGSAGVTAHPSPEASSANTAASGSPGWDGGSPGSDAGAGSGPAPPPTPTGAALTAVVNGTTDTAAASSSSPGAGSSKAPVLPQITPKASFESTMTPPSTTPVTNGPKTWVFGGLTRDTTTGAFSDDALASILQNATETVAQAFRARGTPEVLRVVELMGIEQARQWGVCTLNEFRRYLGLREYKTFQEWNPDPEISRAAEALYGHIDKLELYVGMQAEEAKKPGEGAGLCPGYTISRAILGDAVALTRGDRFLTNDLTPHNLTAWGFQDCARDPNNGAFGSGIAKLLFRALPDNYTYNSVYGLFPFYTPTTISGILKKHKIARGYDLVRPVTRSLVIPVNTWQGVDQVLKDHKTFKTTYSDHMKNLTNGYGFFLAWDEPEKHGKDMKLMRDALFPNDQALKAYGDYYRTKTAELIKEKSFSMVGKTTRSVDIVRDVLNLVPVHWISTQIAGIPLKTNENPGGAHTEQEVYQWMAVVFTYIFLDVQPETGWILRAAAEKIAGVVQNYTETRIDSLKGGKIIGKLKNSFLELVTDTPEGYRPFLKRLAATGRRTDELAYNVFGIVVAATANFAMAAALVVNFYLDDSRKAEYAEVVKLVQAEPSAESQKRLVGYILEAMRLDPQAPGIFRDVAEDAEIVEGDGKSPITVKKGQRLFVSLRNANLDPTAFPDPQKVDPTRPLDKYKIFGTGMHVCLGQWFTQAMMPQVMRSIFSLKNVRRAPGRSGQLDRFVNILYETTPSWCYVDAKGCVSPWPGSMLIQYDL